MLFAFILFLIQIGECILWADPGLLPWRGKESQGTQGIPQQNNSSGTQ